jgi:hypothetical protein
MRDRCFMAVFMRDLGYEDSNNRVRLGIMARQGFQRLQQTIRRRFRGSPKNFFAEHALFSKL